jgi:hypothetical protein
MKPPRNRKAAITKARRDMYGINKTWHRQIKGDAEKIIKEMYKR